MNIKQNSKTVTAHMVVKNEDRWIWFSIMSIIDYVDKIIIFDTGSIDNTRKIIKNILKNKQYKEKIIYEEFSNITVDNFYKVRQRQIDMTNTDYFMIVDGDEIWYKESLSELSNILNSCEPHLVATRFINCCSDIFHYRDDKRESYTIAGITGSITIRIYSMSISGIRCGGEYGVEGFLDSYGNPVQESCWRIVVMKEKYLHTSLLNRSSATIGDFSIKYRRSKIKQKWDQEFSENFMYPEVFYINRPKYVKSPFKENFNIIRVLYNYFHKMFK